MLARFVGSRRTSAFLGPHIVREEGGSGWKILYLAKFHQATTIAISLLPFSCVIGVHSLPLCLASQRLKYRDRGNYLQSATQNKKELFSFPNGLSKKKGEEGRGKRGSTDFCRIHFPQ